MSHVAFATTSRGLRREIPPMVLYEKAKRLGIWNPSDIDFSQDRVDWRSLKDDEREVVLHLTSMFQAGEEAVTIDLLPLISVVAEQGHIEEELYLTTFLFEEAKHCDFFSRFFTEVAGDPGDLTRFHGPMYQMLFYEALPSALNALRKDVSPMALCRASATYNLIVEGVLAETGYHAYFTVLDKFNILPGQRKGISLLKQDEARHIAYGIFLLSRLMAEDESLWQVIEDTMNELLQPAMGIIAESLSQYDPIPFGMEMDHFTLFAMGQFEKRLERIKRARGMTLEEVYKVTNAVIEGDDA
ncbi:MAG: R2-like ligand binding oxidase [Candidatus Hydrogenedentota bacterium]